LEQLNDLKSYSEFLPENAHKHFFQAVLKIHQNKFDKALEEVNIARTLLDTELKALIGESYNRAYNLVVFAQQLAEMEETIEFKRSGKERQDTIKTIWTNRLVGIQRNPKHWQEILFTRSMVLSPLQDKENWLKFSSLCRKTGITQHFTWSKNTLIMLTNGVDPWPSWIKTSGKQCFTGLEAPAEVVFAWLKHGWDYGYQKTAVSRLMDFISYLPTVTKNKKLEAKCHHTLGNWLTDLSTDKLTEVAISMILGSFKLAVQKDKNWYKHWHSWALANFEVVSHYEKEAKKLSSPDKKKKLKKTDMKVIKGFRPAKRGTTVKKKSSVGNVRNAENARNKRQSLHEEIVGSMRRSMRIEQEEKIKVKGEKRRRGSRIIRNHEEQIDVFDIISKKAGTQSKTKPLTVIERKNRLMTCVKAAIGAFFRSISLAPAGKTLQDTLRLLTLSFKYGHHSAVYSSLMDGFDIVSIDTWVEVIPQLIARIHSPVPSVQRMVHHLLKKVGSKHPQALVYPLSVQSKSDSPKRKLAANKLLNKIRKHNASLVEASQLVSEELIRVAIPWHEIWNENLDEAWRLWATEKDPDGMINLLLGLHELVKRGPETPREVSFMQQFGTDIVEAESWLMKFQKTGNTVELSQAWDHYVNVFRSVNSSLPQVKTLHLRQVSPKLYKARDLDLSVPGTYDSRHVVKIGSFNPILDVIASKQRPRKLSMYGDDGKEYTFLLKGHEDLRQDERVMQLFKLINTLLATDRDTANRHLAIQRYAIIPLSPDSGLIGWVPNHDTLHALVVQHRRSKTPPVPPDFELSKMINQVADLKKNNKANLAQLCLRYERLNIMQKTDVFIEALSYSSGNDIQEAMWLVSPSSEVWLDRRTNFTRSLAVMSMVGYILGLGDRHPSNIMLNRTSGAITHIDFGDCFEVAMTRDKHPEQVPFRLTRMLIKGMGVSGIEGNFRITCEHVMRVIRENKDSVMAVLEAFVYDPLINWRLLQHHVTDNANETNGDSDAIRRVVIGSQQSTAPSTEVPQSIKTKRETTMSIRNTSSMIHGTNKPITNDEQLEEFQNERAVDVIDRISAKLRGKDFDPKETLDVRKQVTKLIDQASSPVNLSQSYRGWYAVW